MAKGNLIVFLFYLPCSLSIPPAKGDATRPPFLMINMYHVALRSSTFLLVVALFHRYERQARPGQARLCAAALEPRTATDGRPQQQQSFSLLCLCVHQLNCVRACVCVCVDLWRLLFLQFSFVCRCFSEFEITRLKSNKGKSSSSSSSQQKASHSHFFLIVVAAAVIRVLLSHCGSSFLGAVRENERM